MREGSKMPMTLTEIAVMALIFGICGAVCLSIFSSSRALSKKSGELGEATVWAQSAAEAYKAAGGDVSSAAAILGAEEDGQGAYVLGFDSDWAKTAEDGEYALTLTETGPFSAHIEVSGASGAIFALDVKEAAYG